MKKWFLVAALVITLSGAAECLSSYVLYRHFSRLNRSFFPQGSASVALVHAFIGKLKGQRDVINLSIDHGPLFRADATLGFAMYPGRYRITEQFGPRSHSFNLTIDAAGRRITAARTIVGAKRIFIAGDSLVFGWGLNDDQTLPWLLQERFPDYQVINLSLTSYSTVDALLQLESIVPKIASGDIVVLSYHPITNEFNVASDHLLEAFQTGFEHQLGDATVARDMDVRFGYIGATGALNIGRVSPVCTRTSASPSACAQRQLSPAQATRVTESAFEAIHTAIGGRLVVAWNNGLDDDPVIGALRHHGITVVDLRPRPEDPDADDEMPVDGHAGPFYHALMAQRLGDWLGRVVSE